MCYSFLFTRFGSEESPQLKLLSIPGTAGSGAPGRLMTGCGGRGVEERMGMSLNGNVPGLGGECPHDRRSRADLGGKAGRHKYGPSHNRSQYRSGYVTRCST